MPDATAPGRMFVRAPNSQQGTIALPLVTALLEPGSRYSMDDPRFGTAAKTPPKPKPAVPATRGRPRGPTAATLEKLWHEANGDRVVFKRALDACLRRSGLMR